LKLVFGWIAIGQGASIADQAIPLKPPGPRRRLQQAGQTSAGGKGWEAHQVAPLLGVGVGGADGVHHAGAAGGFLAGAQRGRLSARQGRHEGMDQLLVIAIEV